ncbi:MAG: PAS domain-containing protein [Spirochaetia bacterium]
MDGAESARAILAERSLPIVFLSRHSEREVVERVKHISGYGYVLKSSGEFVLVETIYMALRLCEAQTRLEQENIEHLRTAEKLRERNAFIETVLDNLPIGLSVNYMDDGTATYMNKRFEAVYGWPREILTDISQFFECVFPEPGYRNELQAKILADMASGDPTHMLWDNIFATT